MFRLKHGNSTERLDRETPLARSITTLPGVGPKTKTLLHTYGITTIDALLRYKGGPIPRMNIEHLKALALSSLGETTELTNHNWYNHIVHIVRARKRVVRARVKQLNVKGDNILLLVEWRERTRIKTKTVTPVALLALQIMWLNNDIVSDDSGSDSPEVVTTPLPKFLVDPEDPYLRRLNLQQQKSLRHTVREVNQLYNCLYLGDEEDVQ